MAEQKKYEYELKKEDFVESTKDGVKHFTNEKDHIAEIRKSVFGEEKIKEYNEEVKKFNTTMQTMIVDIASNAIKSGEKEVVVEYKANNKDVQTHVSKNGDDCEVITKLKFENTGPVVTEIKDEILQILSKI